MEKKVLEINKILDGVDDFIIIAEYPEVDYTLIRRNSTFQPWVATWGLNKEGKYWQQGHYFQRLEEAIDYIQSVIGRKKAVVDLDLSNELIEAFEDFLDEKGIDIPNDEKEESECPSTIYGTDYGDLQNRINEVLANNNINVVEVW